MINVRLKIQVYTCTCVSRQCNLGWTYLHSLYRSLSRSMVFNYETPTGSLRRLPLTPTLLTVSWSTSGSSNNMISCLHAQTAQHVRLPLTSTPLTVSWSTSGSSNNMISCLHAQTAQHVRHLLTSTLLTVSWSTSGSSNNMLKLPNTRYVEAKKKKKFVCKCFFYCITI